MDLRRRNNLLILISAGLIVVLSILTMVERERNRSRDGSPPGTDRPASILSLAIESVLTEEGMADSLFSGGSGLPSNGLSPAESLLIRDLAAARYLSEDSVRHEYLRVRESVLRRRGGSIAP